jgi:alpha-galactosidase
MTLKITIIGAGSAEFSISLIRDLCLTPSLAEATVCFMDIDARRLETAHALCARYAGQRGVSLRLEQTTLREQALEGADFVVNAALVAGHERLRQGWKIAQRHGYRMGGSFHILHDEAFWVNFYQLRLFDSLLQDILRICPGAWYIQIANSVLSGITSLGRKYPSAKIVGLCHGPNQVRGLIHQLGLDPDECEYEMLGVNHFIFLTRLQHQGRDLFPVLDRWMEQEGPRYWKACPFSDYLGPVPFDIYKRFGVFPIGDTANPGGGAWPWWYHTDDRTERRWREAPLAWYNAYFRLLERRLRLSQTADPLQIFGTDRSGEQTVPLIESIACDLPRTFIVNIPNRGRFVPGVPDDFEVEVPALVDQQGVQGKHTNGLPPAILAHVLHDRVAPVEMELAAFQQGSKSLLRQLVLMDPWTLSLKQADAFLDAILALPYHAEMRAHYR